MKSYYFIYWCVRAEQLMFWTCELGIFRAILDPSSRPKEPRETSKPLNAVDIPGVFAQVNLHSSARVRHELHHPIAKAELSVAV
jgi:hypothetical protein